MTITMHLYTPADRQRLIDFRLACTTRENAYDYPTVADRHQQRERRGALCLLFGRFSYQLPSAVVC